ncbi:MAG: FkbM family methyltransferase [Acidimicrobiia bacterium]|nr:FkbM family methyltransferase [Acidimicrobiia bacterium]NNL98590.1 FkbM family methyltransferase [Acidimicrobiia bacterium]
MANLPPHAKLTYSSHGEDAVLAAIYEEHGGLPEAGFYVDVGAYHPTAVSNTALLYEAGWRGINIEPNPAMADYLTRLRPGDITLQQAAGTPGRTANLLFFGDWASSNTLDPDFGTMISTSQNVPIERSIPTAVVPLSDVFAEHLPPSLGIDFLTVDVEGMDVEVLESNDWGRYRPGVVAVEDLTLRLEEPADSAVFRLLTAEGYRFVSHALKTSFYLSPELATT